jgi:hypothetical protein
MKGEKKYQALLAVKVTGEAYEALVANAERLGSSKEIVVRDLVRAFNRLCENGVRATFPLRLASPAYRIVGEQVENAPLPYPEINDAAELQVAEVSEPPEFAGSAGARRAVAAMRSRATVNMKSALQASSPQPAKSDAIVTLRKGKAEKTPMQTRVDSGREVS